MWHWNIRCRLFTYIHVTWLYVVVNAFLSVHVVVNVFQSKRKSETYFSAATQKSYKVFGNNDMVELCGNCDGICPWRQSQRLFIVKKSLKNTLAVATSFLLWNHQRLVILTQNWNNFGGFLWFQAWKNFVNLGFVCKNSSIFFNQLLQNFLVKFLVLCSTRTTTRSKFTKRTLVRRLQVLAGF